MKACNIYKTKTDYIIVTSSMSDIGLFITDDPIYVLPLDGKNDDLQAAVFDSLNKSKKGIPTPKRDEWPKWQKEQLKKMGQKSYSSLYKNSSSCDLRFENGILKIYPEKFQNPDKPSNGLVSVDNDMVEFEEPEKNREAVISKIIELLGQKYR